LVAFLVISYAFYVASVVIAVESSYWVWSWYVCSFNTSAISVRLGKVVPQSLVKNFDRNRYPPAQWKHICIEGLMKYLLLTAGCLSFALNNFRTFLLSLV